MVWSAMSFAVSANAVDGLIGRYYTGYSVVSNRIVFDGLPLVSTQTNTSFDFWDGSRYYDWNPIGGGSYSVHWTGFLRITEPGWHGFGTISDDGSEVWIDGNRVVDNHEQQWYDWQEAWCYLGAGYHSIDITFYEALSYSGIEVWWLVPAAGPSVLPYSGDTFHTTPPTFNNTTHWQILGGPALSTEAPYVNPLLTARRLPATSEVQLTWSGSSNVTYTVESSTNLAYWQNAAGPLAGISGVMTQALSHPESREFFRLRLQ